MAFWQLTYNGVTQDADAWGVSKPSRQRRCDGKTDTVKFKMPGLAVDDPNLPFPCMIGSVPDNQIPWVFIKRNGQPWFAGIVASIERYSDGKEEGVNVVINGPGWFLERTTFQQQFQYVDLTGAVLATQATLQGDVILSQNLDAVKMNTGQVMLEVLIYAQYAYQMIPFPAAVDLSNLPPAPANPGPFIIGALTPSITIPYAPVKDKSCMDIIRLMMKYTPDAVIWTDYSTTPPTINIDRRGNLAANLGPGGSAKTIKAETADFYQDGYKVAGFKPKPRYDLMVPVVVAKFQTKNTFNGATVAQLVIDSFPPAPPGVDQTAWESQPGAWVQTIDLLGSSTTVQKAQIKSIARPVTAQAQEALQWVLSKLPWLSASKRGIPYQDINAPLYDLPHITLDSILTVIDANDPLNDPDQNPNNITLPGCPQLVYELVSHSFPPWLQQDPNDLDVAKVLITALLKYSGTDPETMAVFTFNPTSPKTPTAPGAGYVPLIYGCRVTNAATNSYTQLTSSQAGEPVPQGYAQYLYGCLSQLFQQGTLTIIEQECSDLLPPGCTFNAVDGLAEWQTMQALVLAVDEDIENGTTKVTFGPPIHLGLDTREELFRANLGRLPSYKLQQRTSGLLEGGSNVVGAEHAAVSESSTAPQPISVQLGPFQVQSRANPADISGNTFQVKVTLNGKFLNVDASNVTVNKPSNSDADGWTNLNANDTLWFDGPVAAGACPTVNIKSYGNGDNSYSGGGYWVGGGLTESDGATPPNQTVLRKVIAVFVADSKGRPSLQTQQTTTNLQMQNTAFSWRPALYPGPT